MNKKTILIIIAVVVLASLGFAFYYYGGTEVISNIVGGGTAQPTGDAFPTSGKIGTGGSARTGNEQPTQADDMGRDAQKTTSSAEEIKKVSDVAVAGMTFVVKSGQNFLRYIEKGTGHIKEITFDERIPTDITNTTITAIFDSVWGANGDNLILRRLDGENNTIQTIYGVIGADSSASGVSGAELKKLSTTLLPQSTMAVAVSPDKSKILYLAKSGEKTLGIISDFGNSGPSNKKTQIWESPIKEWSISWPSLNKISLLTKPSYGVGGYLFSLGTDGKNAFEKILGNIPGLTSLTSKTGNMVLYSETAGTEFMTYYFDQKDDGISVFPVQTLPEKCVFSRLNEKVLYCGVPGYIIGSKYPDIWYQGLASFSDSIYKIDLDVNYSGEVVGQEKLGSDTVDVTNPILSEDENYLAFINKKDSTLWMVKVK